jgi:hypothetical protein
MHEFACRAPTIAAGLTPFCKDSFKGTARYNAPFNATVLAEGACASLEGCQYLLLSAFQGLLTCRGSHIRVF